MSRREFWAQGLGVLVVATVIWCAMAYGHADAAELVIRLPETAEDIVVVGAQTILFVAAVHAVLHALMWPARRGFWMGDR